MSPTFGHRYQTLLFVAAWTKMNRGVKIKKRKEFPQIFIRKIKHSTGLNMCIFIQFHLKIVIKTSWTLDRASFPSKLRQAGRCAVLCGRILHLELVRDIQSFPGSSLRVTVLLNTIWKGERETIDTRKQMSNRNLSQKPWISVRLIYKNWSVQNLGQQ